MSKNKLPLQELSIQQLFSQDSVTYEIPIYQRNYAWEKDEITTLVRDIYDSFNVKKNGKKEGNGQKPVYYLGTLVTYRKEEDIFEVIDGQQRLTTLYLLWRTLKQPLKSKLRFRSRKKSDDTIKRIDKLVEDNDKEGKDRIFFEFEDNLGLEHPQKSILQGLKYVRAALKEIVPKDSLNNVIDYFKNKVHIIHYEVPKDVDLNHYFEVMNSRGEQLEKHEIIKARLIEKLKDKDKGEFSRLWENCSQMNVYIQQKYKNDTNLFGKDLRGFKITDFDVLGDQKNTKSEDKEKDNSISINEILRGKGKNRNGEEEKILNTFQPIIDFPNFLLIVLKITRIGQKDSFEITDFTLDDKELIREFDKIEKLYKKSDEKKYQDFIKEFSINLLRCKFFLDNYIVHQSHQIAEEEGNPWQLQTWYQKTKTERYFLNLSPQNESDKERNTRLQNKLVHLLSMFEVSFTARQRKNYLFYCLLYLNKKAQPEEQKQPQKPDLNEYCSFLENLAKKYFKDVYLVKKRLNDINTPKPESFDNTLIKQNKLHLEIENQHYNFNYIYGDGKNKTLYDEKKSRGIPLFIFNYLDYKLWEKYADKFRDKSYKESFESTFGCTDFGLDIFKRFYFSRTRRSLEHFFPQAESDGKNGRPDQNKINCLGNYAMIGAEINSSGSNSRPIAKLTRYLDKSEKIPLVSVSSLKFMIMMQICKDNRLEGEGEGKREDGLEWDFRDIEKHQEKMLKILEIENNKDSFQK